MSPELGGAVHVALLLLIDGTLLWLLLVGLLGTRRTHVREVAPMPNSKPPDFKPAGATPAPRPFASLATVAPPLEQPFVQLSLREPPGHAPPWYRAAWNTLANTVGDADGDGVPWTDADLQILGARARFWWSIARWALGKLAPNSKFMGRVRKVEGLVGELEGLVDGNRRP